MSEMRPRSSASGGSWRPPVPSKPSTMPVSRQEFLARHVTGDWGDLDDEDRSLNDAALIDGSRILSAYQTRKGERIWVITEAANEVGLRYLDMSCSNPRSIDTRPISTDRHPRDHREINHPHTLKGEA